MRNRFKFACLLVIAPLCTAFAGPAAAQSPTARVSDARARAAAAAPGVPWTQVRFEFEGNRFFTSEQLGGVAAACYGRRDGMKEFDAEMLDYCLRKDVVEFMRHTGFLRAKVGEPRTARPGADVAVTVPVEEGELYRLGRVSLEGAAYFDAEDLRALLPLKRGDVADGSALARWAFEHLKKKYADEGFIEYEPEIEPEFRVEPGAEEGVVDVAVTINEGRRFKLRKLVFRAEGHVPEEELRGAFSLGEGEVFSEREFDESVRRLNRLALFEPGGRFEEVEDGRDITFQADAETSDLDIIVRLTERGRERPAAGAAEGGGRPGTPSLKMRRPQTREE